MFVKTVKYSKSTKYNLRSSQNNLIYLLNIFVKLVTNQLRPKQLNIFVLQVILALKLSIK